MGQFNLILGGNFEEDFTFEQWLKRKGNLDGVFLQGMVNEKMLASLKKHKLPYVVMGNYDISPEHPQVLFNINSVYERSLPELFRRNQWKELAILAADGSLRADRETVDVIRKTAAANAVDCSGELLMRTGGDGYEEIRQLLKKRTPDALLIIGEHWVGMQKFRDRHPRPPQGARKTSVLCARPVSADSFWYRPVPCPRSSYDTARLPPYRRYIPPAHRLPPMRPATTVPSEIPDTAEA